MPYDVTRTSRVNWIFKLIVITMYTEVTLSDHASKEVLLNVSEVGIFHFNPNIDGL